MKTEPGFGELARKDPRVEEILQVAAAARRHGAQLLRACRRRGDLARTAQGTGPALPHQQRRNCHPVRHERSREAAASQDGFPGPDHAYADRRRAETDRKAPRRAPGARGSSARRSGHATKSSPKASPAASSSSNRPACATSCAATIPPASKISRRSTRSTGPAPSRAAWSTISSIASTAAKPSHTTCRNSRRSSKKPTASSCTRNR